MFFFHEKIIKLLFFLIFANRLFGNIASNEHLIDRVRDQFYLILKFLLFFSFRYFVDHKLSQAKPIKRAAQLTAYFIVQASHASKIPLCSTDQKIVALKSNLCYFK
jgi:hypothetical protein